MINIKHFVETIEANKKSLKRSTKIAFLSAITVYGFIYLTLITGEEQLNKELKMHLAQARAEAIANPIYSDKLKLKAENINQKPVNGANAYLSFYQGFIDETKQYGSRELHPAAYAFITPEQQANKMALIELYESLSDKVTTPTFMAVFVYAVIKIFAFIWVRVFGTSRSENTPSNNHP